MKKIESYEDYRQNNAEILSAIKKVVVENNGDIYVPYMFDEDDYDEDDYQQLVEDEYLVSVGNILTDENDNLDIDVWVENGMREEESIRVAVVGVTLDCYGNVAVVSPSQNVYPIYDCSRLDILDVYYKLKGLGYDL